MSHKSARIDAFVEPFQGRDLDPHYLAFFECFNRELFFEAHEVLEELWLANPGENYRFYKGLIQLAGAFVHLQRHRAQPAVALFRLAAANLRAYPHRHQRLDVQGLLGLIEAWVARVSQSIPGVQPVSLPNPPKLSLFPPSS